MSARRSILRSISGSPERAARGSTDGNCYTEITARGNSEATARRISSLGNDGDETYASLRTTVQTRITLPGFMMFCGSSARLIERMASSSIWLR